MNSSGHHWFVQVRNRLYALWLLVFVAFEGYTAAATTLDHSTRFPTWESKVGWFLFVLPCELLVALALLLRRERANLGFHLVTANIFVYAVFLSFEAVHEDLNRTMFAVVACGWPFLLLRSGQRISSGIKPRRRTDLRLHCLESH